MQLPHDEILFFDGECAFCQRSVHHIVVRNERKNLFFCSLQSPLGQHISREIGLPSGQLSTLVFCEKGKCFTKSTALRHLLPHLRGHALSRFTLALVPTILADFTYDCVARFRHKLSRHSSACPIPPDSWKKRVLHDLP